MLLFHLPVLLRLACPLSPRPAAQASEAGAALEAGLGALRALNTEYAASLALMRQTRAEKANREGIKVRAARAGLGRTGCR